MKKHYDYLLLAAALISVGAILVFNNSYFGYPPELRWLENSDGVGISGIVGGLCLVFWTFSNKKSPLVISTGLVMSVFFWSSVAIFELMHDQAFGDLHGFIALVLEVACLVRTFILIFQSQTKVY